uniref:Uncharacterized protein n=1 Tax=Glossina pallidipes TaxID=7398 RepID=A0A1A9ZGC2_GLOPL
MKFKIALRLQRGFYFVIDFWKTFGSAVAVAVVSPFTSTQHDITATGYLGELPAPRGTSSLPRGIRPRHHRYRPRDEKALGTIYHPGPQARGRQKATATADRAGGSHKTAITLTSLTRESRGQWDTNRRERTLAPTGKRHHPTCTGDNKGPDNLGAPATQPTTVRTTNAIRETTQLVASIGGAH